MTNYKNIELMRTSHGSLIIGLKPNICKYNVLTIDTLDELIDALEYHINDEVKALIIAPSAHSENFGVGADLNVINSGDKIKFSNYSVKELTFVIKLIILQNVIFQL